jgi:hypothetical protein
MLHLRLTFYESEMNVDHQNAKILFLVSKSKQCFSMLQYVFVSFFLHFVGIVCGLVDEWVRSITLQFIVLFKIRFEAAQSDASNVYSCPI